MFADPQSVTINAVPISLPRVSVGDNSGKYLSADGAVSETVKHTYGKRARRTVRINHSKVAVDPLIPTMNAPYSMSCYLTVDAPNVGYTVVEQKYVVDGFLAQLQATSGLLITKILGGEG